MTDQAQPNSSQTKSRYERVKEILNQAQGDANPSYQGAFPDKRQRSQNGDGLERLGFIINTPDGFVQVERNDQNP